MQAGARKDEFIHLPSNPDQVVCELQEEEDNSFISLH